ncbi:MAG: hypothetical protein J1F39_03270 [Clostridiales bacterium]|nr:hypothetical protein [Clostridiales bacterium]
MGEGFKKKKRKFLQAAIIKSAVCGISFGLFAFGAVFLALKLFGVTLNNAIYAVIAVGVALLGGGAAFLLLKPSDKKVAAELDSRYGLNEKVQSALAFSGAEGAVNEMLQADTDARLLALPKDKFEFKRIWKVFLIAILSVAVFVSSLVVPSRLTLAEGGDGGGGGETVIPTAQFVFTEDQMDALQELIDNVNGSKLNASVKAEVVAELNKLVNNLMFAEYNSEMIEYVDFATAGVDKVVKQPLTYKAIANALGSAGQNVLAKMIADGVQTAYTQVAITNYTSVDDFYANRVTLVGQTIDNDLSAFFDYLLKNESASSDADEETPSIGVVEKTFTEIYLALSVSGADEDDGLRTVLFDLAKGLAQSGVLTNDVSFIFDVKFKAELSDHAYRLAVTKYVTNRIREIFKLKIPSDEIFVPTYSQAPDLGDSKDDPSQGGFGKGDMLYGSDDAVYDPITGEYRKYGEIFNDYYAAVEALLRDGNLTEEQKAVIRAYFEILFSGIKEQKE